MSDDSRNIVTVVDSRAIQMRRLLSTVHLADFSNTYRYFYTLWWLLGSDDDVRLYI